MKILITGATGFIGKNLVDKIEEKYPKYTLYKTSSSTAIYDIEQYTKNCDFVFNLAAVHRPVNPQDFININYLKFKYILDSLKNNNNSCPVLYTSSIQANNDSEYGKSKILAENELKKHGKTMNSRAIIYRLSNTFGPFGRPNGHSVVATFCYNIQRNIPIKINDSNYIINFYYVGDVINSFIDRINEKKYDDSNIYSLNNNLIYSISIGELADLLYYFKQTNKKDIVLDTLFKEKLFSTFESYKEN